MQQKSIILILAILAFGLVSNAQDNKVSTLVSAGITTPILDNGTGFYLGVHPTFQLSSRIYAEGQISYMYYKITSSFISGNRGDVNSVNTLAGLRLYINAPKKRNRFFINLLGGLNYIKEKINGVERDGEFGFGISTGAFLQINRIIVGLSFDSPQNYVLKVGYNF